MRRIITAIILAMCVAGMLTGCGYQQVLRESATMAQNPEYIEKSMIMHDYNMMMQFER